MATSCGDDVNLDDFANLGSVIGTPAPVPVTTAKDDILKALEAVIAAVKKL
jgi:phosphoribosylcarboxyaminoimidazole (NCAIR) mutase